jgi:hypothetical protein
MDSVTIGRNPGHGYRDTKPLTAGIVTVVGSK